MVNPAGGKLIPSRIEAEDFDAKLGEWPCNTHHRCRRGQKVVGITNGSWMDYNVIVTQSGHLPLLTSGWQQHRFMRSSRYKVGAAIRN